MNEAITLEQLRELFLNAPDSEIARFMAIVGSVALSAVILFLVRTRRLREEYTPIWMGVAVALLVLSFRMDLLRAITRAIGAWTYSSTLFFMGELFLVVICLNFAVRLSRTSLQLKTLGQEVALLRSRLDSIGDRSGSNRQAPEDPR